MKEFFQSMKDFFRNCLNNPKTSAAAVAGLAMALKAIIANPAMLSDPLVLAQIFSSAGLLFSPDANSVEGK